MKNYKIPVTWKSWGLLDINADSLKEAIKIAKESSLPEKSEFICDSFKVDLEGVEIYNTEEGEREEFKDV